MISLLLALLRLTLFWIGMFDGLDKSIRNNIILYAMCFPTPRDQTTDRVNAVFDRHINLSPNNKYVFAPLFHVNNTLSDDFLVQITGSGADFGSAA